jgi:membrane protease YdiL (CAAX protease family)
MEMSDDDPQYSLLKILTIWAIVTVPMPILAFVVAPMISAPGTGTATYFVTVWMLLICGMIWQFIVSVFVLYRELDEFTWSAIKARIWLQKPRDPKTGEASYKLFWWLIPAFGFYALIEMTPIVDNIGRLILIPLPGLATLPDLDLRDLATPDFVGAWWLMGVALVACLFNYVLGEELLFRGVLLPKMRGVFGKWDWFANAVLFALYHLHRPVLMLGFIIGDMVWALTTRRFRSMWFGIILHGFEGIFVIVGFFAVVSGLAF